MCQHPLHDLLIRLPKCEHHLHIEGSLTPELLFALAAKNNVSLPTSEEDPSFASVEALYARYESFTSLDDFLAYYYIGFRVLLHASDFEELAYAYFTRAHADHVRHAEISFDPQAHTSRGVPYETIVAGLQAAQRRAEGDFGMSTALIMCMLRHLPVPDSEAMFALAQARGHFEDGTLAGIGMDSSEVPFPPAMFTPIFATAKEKGIRRTAHVCEEGPPEYMPAAIHHLDIQRIDHGVRAAEDAQVLQLIADRGLMMTVCPISNVKLRCFDKMEQVPIRTLLDAGVKFSINSDDPSYFGGFIQACYCAVAEAFDLSVEEWERIVNTAVEGSWCSEERKGALRGEIDAVLGQWRGQSV